MKMEEKLYDYMDWAEIEAVVYSEENHPRDILGPRVTEDGILIQAFFPGATRAAVHTIRDGKQTEMVCEDEAGFFAVLLPGKKIPSYTLIYWDGDGNQMEHYDPYAYPMQFTEQEQKQFENGICYSIYEKLGAHPVKIDGVSGVYFAVWAPNAIRVSVVGNFNNWDGRAYQMNLLESGIYELFIPGVRAGDIYKYEIKAKGGLTYLKSDPYANAAQLRPNNASVVDLGKYAWQDENWMKKRGVTQGDKAPISVYEVHLGSWKKPDDGREFYNYREIAPMLASYVKELGYTHVELMPVMEHPLDESWGYQVTGYYAPTSRYGTPKEFKYLVDYLHKNKIGVILDWVPAHFPKDAHGLADFDGQPLYEYADPRKGEHPEWGTKIFDYGKNEVKIFMLANALYWVEEYHVDGLRVDAVASMLYLDYGKEPGQWVPNKNGGNENLEAVEFFKHLNTLVRGRNKGVIMIAEESTTWPKVTGSVEDGGLHFSYKWNMGWMHDFLDYMKLDPYFRKYNHNKMTFGMTYAFSENYILVLSHDEVVHLKCSMINKMPGNLDEKFQNLMVGYAFMFGHPGKKLLFMGQDFGQLREWSEEREIDWFLLAEEGHQHLQSFFSDLLKMYRKYPALYANDCGYEGFQWINADDGDRSIYSFVRWSPTGKNNLLFVCNFTPVERPDYMCGVPRKKQYRLILDSSDMKYGGPTEKRQVAYRAKEGECDGQPYRIAYALPAYGVAVFSF